MIIIVLEGLFLLPHKVEPIILFGAVTYNSWLIIKMIELIINARRIFYFQNTFQFIIKGQIDDSLLC
jgi:general stress protein CsbA